MNDIEFKGGFALGFFASSILFAIVLATCAVINTKQWQQEAVKNGAAEYVLNPATGQSTWQWKEAK